MNVRELTNDYTETLLYYLYRYDDNNSNKVNNLLKLLFRNEPNKNKILLIKNKSIFKDSLTQITKKYKNYLFEIYDDKHYTMKILRINKDIVVYLSYINFEDNEYNTFIFFEKKLENKVNRIINSIKK